LDLELPSGAWPLSRVRVMGILNATPDSFYDRGRYLGLDRAVARAEAMAEEGADLIDIGGEKAGPGAPVSVDDELRRVIPVIEAIRGRIDLPLSIDTFKSQVARRAVEAGVQIVNSIGGFDDPAMRQVAAETGAAIVIMHIQGRPRVHHPDPQYGDVVEDVRTFLRARAEDCEAAGIARSKIVVDPGPGFGKSSAHDLALVSGLDRLTDLGYPVLLAASRKKFIGDLLDLETEERLEGSLAVAVWGVLHGARIIRTHDVRATVRVVRMTEAVMQPEQVEEPA
jgi:dihydropteroate synthase